MQRGIDSFFKKAPGGNKSVADKKAVVDEGKPKKRKARIISSDEDDVGEVVPANNNKLKKTRTDASPKEIKASPAAKRKDPKPQLDKLKRVDPSTLFGGETLRVAAKKTPRPKDKALLELEDDEINRSLLDVDVGLTSINDAKTNGKTPTKRSDPRDKEEKNQMPRKSPRKVEECKKEETRKTTPKKEHEAAPPPKKVKVEVVEPKLTTKATKKPAKATPTATVKKEPNEDLETTVLTDEERYERRRFAAQAYQRFKKRPTCLNPGSKEVPKGKPNCFAGLTFLVTGVLDSLERDEVKSIVEECGGKMMTTAGKRLTYLVAGEEAGDRKLEKAKENGTQIISEDDFLTLLRGKPNGKEEKPTTSPKEKKVSPKEKNVIPEKKSMPREKKEEEIKVKHEKKSPHKQERMSEIKQEKKTPLKHEKHSPYKQEKKTPLKQEERSPPIPKDNTPKSSEELNNNQSREQQKLPIDTEFMAWVDKYKPVSVKEIIGQQGAASNVTKLTNWLSRWYGNHDGKKKLTKPSPWAKNDDGAFYKAALLSGGPGIGKTTTATLVCQELGFDVVEFNASDTRSKRLLKEQVAELLSNKSLYGYCHGQAQAISKKHVLLMDEVDGMAGNEDRGGIQELIALIKDSSVPIICMCNDRNHQKMRALVNYCYDLRFIKPRLEQIKGRLLSICCKEKFKLEHVKLEEIITASNFDIRQSINHIALMSGGKELSLKSAQPGVAKTAHKDMKVGPWDVVRRVFTASEQKEMSFMDKCDLFFHDYSMAPLFVQQNYLQVSPAVDKSEVLNRVAMTADALSLGDLADKRIRSAAAWSLLPTQAVFSSVMPGAYMSGHFVGQINFPGWLGKNSRSNKRNRLAQELHDHTRVRTSGSKRAIRLDYAPYLLAGIARPLREQGLAGVAQALDVLKEYHLLREDIESLIELSSWPGRKSPMDAVDGRVKAALTRAYNKEVLAYTYSAAAGVKKKKAAVSDESLAGFDDEDGEGVNANDSEEEKDADALELDGLIKAKKTTAATTKAKAAANGSGPKAGTSKATTSKARK